MFQIKYILMSLLIFIFFLLKQTYQNAVKDGDFQSYKGPFFTGAGCLYYYLPSNNSRWFTNNSAPYEIQKVLTPYFTTNSIDLSGNQPYNLCQNIGLTPSKKYRIAYSLYSQKYHQKMLLTATVGGSNISALYIQGPNSAKNQVSYFYASQSQSLLCFSEVHELFPPYSYTTRPTLIAFGGLIDNISVIQADYYSIEFLCTFMEEQSKISLNSSFPYNQTIVVQLKKQYQLKASGLQLSDLQYIKDQNGHLAILSTCNFSFLASSLHFEFSNSTGVDEMMLFNLSVNLSQTNNYFHALSSEQKIALARVSYVLKKTKQVASHFINYMKLIFCSYQMLTLISFDSLSLFYIFLNIQSVPLFTKKVYYELLQIQYSSGGFTDTVQKIFNLSANPFMLSYETNNIPEYVQNQKMGQNWFGQYGFSSLVILNNFDNFVMMLLILAKTGLVKLVFRIVSKQNRKRFKIQNSRLFLVIIVQFVGMAPSFVVSAVSRIIYSNIAYGEALQKAIQILIMYLSLVSIGIVFIQARKCKKQSKSLKKFAQKGITEFKVRQLQKIQVLRKNITLIPVQLVNEKSKNISNLLKADSCQFKKKAISNKQKKRILYEISDVFLLFMIPFLVVLYSPKLFLISNSFTLVAKIGVFAKCSARLSVQKITAFLAILVWVTHHVVFCIFFVITQTQSLFSTQNSGLIAILGQVSILTVLLGFCLGILMFLAGFAKMMIFIFKTLIKNCKALKKKKQGIILPKLRSMLGVQKYSKKNHKHISIL